MHCTYQYLIRWIEIAILKIKKVSSSVVLYLVSTNATGQLDNRDDASAKTTIAGKALFAGTIPFEGRPTPHSGGIMS